MVQVVVMVGLVLHTLLTLPRPSYRRHRGSDRLRPERARITFLCHLAARFHIPP